MEYRRITLLDEAFEANVKFVACDPSFGIFQFSKKPNLVVIQLLHCVAPWCTDFLLLVAARTIGANMDLQPDSRTQRQKIAPENWRGQYWLPRARRSRSAWRRRRETHSRIPYPSAKPTIR